MSAPSGSTRADPACPPRRRSRSPRARALRTRSPAPTEQGEQDHDPEHDPVEARHSCLVREAPGSLLALPPDPRNGRPPPVAPRRSPSAPPAAPQPPAAAAGAAGGVRGGRVRRRIVLGSRHEPSERRVAARFAAAWERGDYATMHSLLTERRAPSSRCAASRAPTRGRPTPPRSRGHAPRSRACSTAGGHGRRDAGHADLRHLHDTLR